MNPPPPRPTLRYPSFMKQHSKQSRSRAEINRENAQKSTGPKTAEGKRASSLNAGRHWLTGQIFVLPEAAMPEYMNFTNAFHLEMKSQGIVERNLVHQYADVNWRINHSAAIEKVKLSLTVNDQTGSIDTECAPAHDTFVEAKNFHLHSETLKNISLYETRLANRAAKLLKQITEIQAARKLREEKEMREAVLIYEMEEQAFEKEQKAAAAAEAPSQPFTYAPSEDGFVFSIAQIKSHIRLRDRLLAGHLCNVGRSATANSAV